MKKPAFLLLFLLSSVSAIAQTTINGTWEGAITIQEQNLGIILNIGGEAGNYSGTLDIPAQGANGLPLIYVVLQNDSVSTAFNTGTGMGEFEGKLMNQNIIEGQYTQSGSSFPFRVERQNPSPVDVVEPGAGEELIITNGEVNIAGTLVLPDEESQPQVVILLSGSGAQNRDSEILGFKPFADIAEYLKGEGIASFRFDDRQIGQSTGSFMDSGLPELVADVNSIIRFLEDSVNTKFDETILLGHSQGGVLAGKVAESNLVVDQIILLASPSVSLSRILRYQVRQAYQQFNLPEDAIQNEIAAREQLMKAVTTGEDIDEARESYRKAYEFVLNSLSEEQMQAIPENRESFIDRQTTQLVSYYGSEQMRSLLFHDPAQDLSELSIPVLVLFGGKDTQVSYELNEPAVREALNEAGTEFEIKVFEDANHLFQEAETGEVSEYSTLDKEFIDGFLPTLSQWIMTH